MVQIAEPEQPWLDLSEAAAILGIHVDTLRRKVKRGEVQSRQVPTQHGPKYQVCLGESPTLQSTVDQMPMQEPSPVDESPTAVELIRLMEKMQEEMSKLQLK